MSREPQATRIAISSHKSASQQQKQVSLFLLYSAWIYLTSRGGESERKPEKSSPVLARTVICEQQTPRINEAWLRE